MKRPVLALLLAVALAVALASCGSSTGTAAPSGTPDAFGSQVATALVEKLHADPFVAHIE